MRSLIHTALLKEQIKRFWGAGAAALAVYLFMVVIMHQLFEQAHRRSDLVTARVMVTILSHDHFVLGVAMVVVPLLVVLLLQAHAFGSASTTFMGALPITRRQLFVTNMLAGLVLLVVPLVIFAAVLMVPVQNVMLTTWMGSWHPPDVVLPYNLVPEGYLPVGATINTVPRVLLWLLRSVLGYAVYLGMFMLAFALAGNIFSALVMCGVVAFVPVVPLAVVNAVAFNYVFGSTFHMMAGLQRVLEWGVIVTHPASWALAFRATPYWGGEVVPLWPQYLSFAVLTVALPGLAYMAQVKRRAERAGDAVVFSPIKHLFVFAVCTGGLMLGGALGLAVTGLRVGMLVGYVLGFVATFFLIYMLMERTFRVFSPKNLRLLPRHGVVMLVAYLVMLTVTRFALTGVVNYVPDPRDVARVQMNRFFSGHPEVDRLSDITDPAAIAQITAAHQQIIDNRSYLQRVRRQRTNILNSRSWEHIDEWPHRVNFPFTYVLHCGREIHRQYTLSASFMRDIGLVDILASPAQRVSGYPGLALPHLVDEIHITVITPAAGRVMTTTESFSLPNYLDFPEFIAALRRDWEALGNGTPHMHITNHMLQVNLAIGSGQRNAIWGPNITIGDTGYAAAWLRAHGLMT